MKMLSREIVRDGNDLQISKYENFNGTRQKIWMNSSGNAKTNPKFSDMFLMLWFSVIFADAFHIIVSNSPDFVKISSIHNCVQQMSKILWTALD